MTFADAYLGKTALITGHTGFKGSWLGEWLTLLGARVVGFSIDVPTEPSHFEAIGLGSRLADDIRADIRSLDALQQAFEEHRPDFVFHLAAQPLVRRSYAEPLETFETNVIGSVNVLEAARHADRDCVIVMITTDKVYENREWLHAYREDDPLGGHDPYSASKAAAEIAIASYRRSFFGDGRIAVATARGGNVIGGGDWAEDRIVPDCIRYLSAGRPVAVRNRHATRPWQHVLELAGAYLHLGAEMARAQAEDDRERLGQLCSAFNFGPPVTSNRSVGQLVTDMLRHWPGEWEDRTDPNASHEAGRLNLAADKAYHLLGWQPLWSFEETVERTVEWYRRARDADTATVRALTGEQIDAFIGQKKRQLT